MTILMAFRDNETAQHLSDALRADGFEIVEATDPAGARKAILTCAIHLAILDLDDLELSPLVLADLLVYRHPGVSILPITKGTRFVDGSLYEVMPNVRFMVTPGMGTQDVRAAVDYCLQPPSGSQLTAYQANV